MFARWTETWLAAEPTTRTAALAAEGTRLARERRAAFRELIQDDPRTALAAAVPYDVRKRLPPEILSLLEAPVSGSFEYKVTIACGGEHGAEGHADAITREAVHDETVLRAFTYGERLDITSKRALGVHGVSLDDLLAMHASPVRVLSASEALDRGLDPGAGLAVEMIGRLHTLPDAAAVTAWSEALLTEERQLGPASGPLYRLIASGAPVPATPSAAAVPAEAAAPAGGVSTTSAASAEAPTAESAWTEGAKTMLYIRARFSDEAADFSPIAQTTAESRQNNVDTHLRAASYGKMSLTTTYTDVVTLPSAASSYQNAFSTLLLDARTAAKALNPAWDTAGFDLYVVVTSNRAAFSYAGKASVGSAGAHLRSDYTELRTAGHEYGHNLGLCHASYWRTDALSPIGADSRPGGYVSDTVGHERVEYGHRFSLMSAQYTSEFNNATQPHFSAAEKTRLDWLTTSDGVVALATTPATGTTVRIYRQDHASAQNTRGVRLDVPSSDYTTTSASSKRRYWLSYRRAFNSGTPGTYAPYGLEIDWVRSSYGSDGAIQLDMTPYTRDATNYIDQASLPGNYWTIDNSDKEDGQLPLGLTYSDAAAGIHITPIAVGDDDGTANNGNEWIEAEVRLGTFPDNRPPVVTLTASNTAPAAGASVAFTATATDPDGDALSYWWDFADGTVTTSALNNAAPAKSWSTAGARVVRVIVSDRRGGQTTAQLPVIVGAPTNNTEIRGNVLHGGRPVAGARVHIGSTYQTWTDSLGRYVLAGLPAGNHTVAARKDGLTFTAQFTNPVSTAAGGQYGRDFYADQALTPTGAFSISGTVSNNGVALAGVELEAGGVSTTTDAKGAYTISGLPAGAYTVTARLAPYTFTPATRSVTLTSSSVTAQNFDVQRYTISGAILGVGTSRPTIYALDGSSVGATRQGSNVSYTLSVPAGSQTLYAVLSGFALAPSFINPLAVTANQTGRDFVGAAGTDTFAVGGTLTVNGQPLPGATVVLSGGATATTTTTTDQFGRYRFDNLAATGITITPSRPGYTFSPAATAVTPATAITTADFTATGSGATAAPAVSAATASPVTLTAPGGVTLAATASGGAPLTYRWVATTAAGPVTFSTNNSADAASTTATLSAPGNYTFRVTVTNADGFTASRTVSVTATGAPATLVISPQELILPVGATADFNATSFDAVGAVQPVSPVFSATGGGALDAASGLFTAHAVGTHTVTATAGDLTASATVTVVAPPGGIPAISVASTDADCTEDGANSGVFTLTRAGSTAYATTVAYTLGGTATAGDDFAPLAGSVTFAAGQTTATVVVTPLDDALTESDETVVLTLAPGGGYTVAAPASATLTLRDNDATPAAGFAAWIASQPALGAATAPTDDPDRDGLPNLLEYALGADPALAQPSAGPAVAMNGSRLTLTFARSRAELIYEVQASTDLANWTTLATNPGGVGQTITVTDSVDLTPDLRRFLRLRVTNP